jgi:hypothetical protein
VEIVMPENASAERKKRMLAHGAHLVYTDALKGYDEALREVHRRYEDSAQRYLTTSVRSLLGALLVVTGCTSMSTDSPGAAQLAGLERSSTSS